MVDFGAAVGGLAQGLAQGLSLGTQVRRERRLEELQEAQIAAQRGAQQTTLRKLGIQRAQGLVSAIGEMRQLSESDPALAKLLAPTLLQPFIDSSSPEGQRITKGIAGLNPNSLDNLQQRLGELAKIPEVQAVIGTPDFQREFRKNPGKAVFQLTQIAKNARPDAGTRIIRSNDPEGNVVVQRETFDKRTGEVTNREEIGRGPRKITQQVIEPSGGERERMANLRAQIGQVDSLMEALGKFDDPPIGPIAGRTLLARQAIGQVDQQEADFLAQMGGLRNVVLVLRSGAAVTESEAKRLEDELPKPSDTKTQFTAKARRFKANVRRILGEIDKGLRRFEPGAGAGSFPTPARRPLPPGTLDEEAELAPLLGGQ